MSKYHPVSYLADYLHYNSGNECQQNYHLWAAIVAAGVQLCRRVWLSFDYYDIYPNLYVCLVGVQGNRKSVAKDIALDMVADAYPDVPVSSAVMSREAICKFMGSDEAMRSYRDHEAVLIEHRPFAMFINELKQFISIDPPRMIQFLTDIYDRKVYKVDTKNQGKDHIVNPCLNILACETPEWILDQMKMKVISGGFSRRMIYVNEPEDTIRIPFPCIPPGGREAWARVKATMIRLQTYCGPFTWTDEAREWYDSWYRNIPRPSIPMMAAFYRTKHVMMFKLAMITTLADDGLQVLTRTSLEQSAALIERIEPGMQEIALAVGRNELIVPTRNLIAALRFANGALPEKKLRSLMFMDMTPLEYDATIAHLIATEQVTKCVRRGENGVDKLYIAITAELKQAKAEQVQSDPASEKSLLDS